MNTSPPSIAELLGDMVPSITWNIEQEFSGKTLDDIRNALSENDCNWLLEAYGQLSGTGFSYYFPPIEEYARSTESELDSFLPGGLAMAMDLQIQRNPTEALKIGNQIRSVSEYIVSHMAKYDLGDDWANTVLEIYESLLDRLDKIMGEQVAAPDGE